VEAQRVLFANSVHGDLTPLFSGHFDTAVGSKRAPASYSVIADAIGRAPRDIVFLSDVDAELDAARSAGMQTVRLLRPADTPAGATTAHPSAVSFDELDIVSA
jgi:enolase-phosphatase E1